MQVWYQWKERAKEDWAGRVSDDNVVLRRFFIRPLGRRVQSRVEVFWAWFPGLCWVTGWEHAGEHDSVVTQRGGSWRVSQAHPSQQEICNGSHLLQLQLWTDWCSNPELRKLYQVYRNLMYTVWVTPPDTRLRLAEAISKNEGNLEWTVEKGKSENQLHPQRPTSVREYLTNILLLSFF